MDKYVLIKTRDQMKCPDKHTKSIIIVHQLVMDHKVLVEELPDKADAWSFFRDTDFTLPMEYRHPSSFKCLSSFKKKQFLPVHLGRLVKTFGSGSGSSGYKCFGEILGNYVYFVLLNNMCFFLMDYF